MMIDKLTNEIDKIDKQILMLEKRKRTLIEQRSKISTATLQPGMKVKIVYDEWDGFYSIYT